MEVELLATEQTKRLGNRLWVLTENFYFAVDELTYEVPKGFITDGASCPRGLWSLCSPVAGPFGQGAIAHDFFYSKDGPNIGRLNADEILYCFGRYRGSGWARAQAVKSGVNCFGWMSYKKMYSHDKLTSKACYNVEKARNFVGELIHG